MLSLFAFKDLPHSYYRLQSFKMYILATHQKNPKNYQSFSNLTILIESCVLLVFALSIHSSMSWKKSQSFQCIIKVPGRYSCSMKEKKSQNIWLWVKQVKCHPSGVRTAEISKTQMF